MKAMSRRPLIGELWNSIQTWLFPVLEDELGELDEKHRLFVSVCELCAPSERFLPKRPSRALSASSQATTDPKRFTRR